jgi:hypothetical protein
MKVRINLSVLTIQIGKRSYRLVTAQTAVMRGGSRKEFRRSGAPLVNSGRAFSWSGASGAAKSAVFREVPRSTNRRSPTTSLVAVGRVHKGTLTMSKSASGATVTRLFDPNQNNHYALSEDVKHELDMLFGAMAAISFAIDTPPDEEGPEIAPRHMMPLFFTFAAHGRRIMNDLPCQFPGRKKSS